MAQTFSLWQQLAQIRLFFSSLTGGAVRMPSIKDAIAGNSAGRRPAHGKAQTDLTNTVFTDIVSRHSARIYYRKLSGLQLRHTENS